MNHRNENDTLQTIQGSELLRWHLAQVRRPWDSRGRHGRTPGPSMRLATLLDAVGLPRPPSLPDRMVSGIACDSRFVAADTLFVALKGDLQDGVSFLGDAARRGALAAVVDARRIPGSSALPLIPVVDARRALAALAASFHGRPSESLGMLGVTGTNGKTTTAWMARAALQGGGRPCGLVGTIAHETGLGSYQAANTTPSADRLQALLAEMQDAGLGNCVLEVSSHALVQGRVDEVQFDAGIFTNLTRDHLDYHGTMEEYLDAKTELFRRLPRSAVAILNREDPVSELMAEETRARVVTFGTSQDCDFRARIQRMDQSGSEAAVRTPLGPVDLRVALPGHHNLSNALGALAGAVALGVDVEQAAAGISSLQHVPGRVEEVLVPAPFRVLVDYAHTDEGLRQVLRHLRPLVDGQLWVVFGCGGDRDQGKRPLMARAAERGADVCVVTSDNPRREDPLAIIRQVMAGFEHPARVLLEPDREAAIRLTMKLAEPGDLVLLAGKGHERSQIVGDSRVPHDDRQIVRDSFPDS